VKKSWDPTIIRLRYERRSMIITSNRSAAEWPRVLGDPLLASAVVDRRCHHARIIEIDHKALAT
jgi:DNA replication protein DnaC